MPLSLSGRLLELVGTFGYLWSFQGQGFTEALVLANSVTSDTVGVVLFAIRVAARRPAVQAESRGQVSSRPPPCCCERRVGTSRLGSDLIP